MILKKLTKRIFMSQNDFSQNFNNMIQSQEESKKIGQLLMKKKT